VGCQPCQSGQAESLGQQFAEFVPACFLKTDAVVFGNLLAQAPASLFKVLLDLFPHFFPPQQTHLADRMTGQGFMVIRFTLEFTLGRKPPRDHAHTLAKHCNTRTEIGGGRGSHSRIGKSLFEVNRVLVFDANRG
jgi:hypothetical protein